MPLDYFVWAIHRDGEPPVIVDTGFGEKAAAARGRTITRPLVEGLRDAGIDHLLVEDVILTHLHYDHAGSLGVFPNARFHVQDAEMAGATGRAMCDHHARMPFDGEPVVVIGTGGFSQLFEREGVFDALIPDLVLMGLHRALTLNPGGSRRWTSSPMPSDV